MVGSLDEAGAGSQQALRAANARRVLEALHSSGPSTQVAIARSTGLSPATVSNMVKLLVDRGLVQTAPTISSGRRATEVRLVGKRPERVAVGIGVGRTHVRLVLASSAKEVLAERLLPLPVDHRADEAISASQQALQAMLDETGIRLAALVGCGIGVPGPVDELSGHIAHGVVLPQWVGFDVRALWSHRLDLPVWLDNDANLGALGEVTWGPHADTEHLVFVKVGSGVGAGLILGGKVHHGSQGITGELGHVSFDDFGPVCRCGNRGCLELYASVETMLAALPPMPREPDTLPADQVIARVRANDPAALRVLEDAGLALGRGLGGVASLLNPQVIVLGGPLVPLGERYLGPVRRGMHRHVTPFVAEATTLTFSSLGNRGEALGASWLAMEASGATTDVPVLDSPNFGI